MRAQLDLWPKVPRELSEASAAGGALSLCALAMTAWILVAEIGAFARTELASRVDVDAAGGSQLRVTFNMSFPHLHCDHASVDLWDKIGRNQLNVTANVEKWQLDEDGRRRMYQGRNRRALELEHDAHHPPLHELHENGVHVDDVAGQPGWDQHVAAHEATFVEFFAPWCVFCQRLAPTWEALAEELERRGAPVSVASVDCVAWPDFCHDMRVQAFPTLRFYHRGEQANEGEYRFDRTVDAMVDFVTKKIEAEQIYRQYPEARVAHKANWNSDHPGCLVSGFLLVNRVPGNFHVRSFSKHHSLNTFRTNLSHVVHHLSFGAPLSAAHERRLRALGQTHARTASLDGRAYARGEDTSHVAFHHFIHVVPTRYVLGRFWRDRFSAFQTTHQVHVLEYPDGQPPEARFAYDISPMSVVVEAKSRKWYDFVTSLLALIGGTFATFRLASQAINEGRCR
mmetsp:Transcript_35529/g.110033  ORF Transcript_35529/g.110033 Transcript_35529/m.110033 type:complete len:454 (+) Transcript_35529:605-1966(+)